ncbi:hypothetical protein H072_65 [Dactylellina haptotyla CBS 200.50]|uniref:Extracellular membrane protein CFEM domain-containing protein n=1 Tax=Dactylellina haptotyla (strain CBS 200.50) TaxID=1284197 RepID=S8ASG3_DACHA|nr:hypothetical protein H072_65 [Dactylellina haptotyla CBS 200.50]
MQRQRPIPILQLALFACFAAAQNTITTGPQPTASVSIFRSLEYTLQRPCIQTCVWDFGLVGRTNVYTNWEDVGKDLGCGPYAVNGCYCNPKYELSVSSYFSTCIPNRCGSGPNGDPANYVSALSLYNDYCATANGNPTKPIPEPVAVTTPSSGSMVSSASETESAVPNASSSSVSSSAASSISSSDSGTSSTQSTESSTAENQGNPSGGGGGGGSNTKTIGIAVGVSVGSLLIIIGVLVFLLVRRKNKIKEEQNMGGISSRKSVTVGGIEGY